MAVLAEVTPVLEKVSIDEAFLDVTGARRRMGPPVTIGRWVRAEIRRRVGVPASVGIASTKFIAKLASSHAKPDGLLLVPAGATQDFLNVLPVGALWGVGARTQEILARWGIKDVRTLADTDVRHLEKILGRASGRHLHELSHGVDPRRVEPVREEKSVGTETTFFETLTDREHARRSCWTRPTSAPRACARRTCAAVSPSSRPEGPTSPPSPDHAPWLLPLTSPRTSGRPSPRSTPPCPARPVVFASWGCGSRGCCAPTTVCSSSWTRTLGVAPPSGLPTPYAANGVPTRWPLPAFCQETGPHGCRSTR